MLMSILLAVACRADSAPWRRANLAMVRLDKGPQMLVAARRARPSAAQSGKQQIDVLVLVVFDLDGLVPAPCE